MAKTRYTDGLTAQQRYAARNPDKLKAARMKWASKNPGYQGEWAQNSPKRKAILLRHRYKQEAPYPAPATCECCMRPFTQYHGACFDHDHNTGAFRGWLCVRCNTALGHAGDDLEGVLRLVRYLETRLDPLAQ